jgi:hypothetical protein
MGLVLLSLDLKPKNPFGRGMVSKSVPRPCFQRVGAPKSPDPTNPCLAHSSSISGVCGAAQLEWALISCTSFAFSSSKEKAPKGTCWFTVVRSVMRPSVSERPTCG